MATESSKTVNHLHDSEPRWFAVYTRYKREKLVIQRLAERSIHAYLPLQQFTRYYTRKIKHVELPLISCYVFVKIVKSEYVRVLETADVVNFVKLRGHLIAIPEREINILKAITGEQLEVEVTPIQMEAGDEVEITHGRLLGLRGTLIEQHNARKVVIELETLGYALRVQIDPAHLRKVGGKEKRKNKDTGLFEKYSL